MSSPSRTSRAAVALLAVLALAGCTGAPAPAPSERTIYQAATEDVCQSVLDGTYDQATFSAAADKVLADYPDEAATATVEMPGADGVELPPISTTLVAFSNIPNAMWEASANQYEVAVTYLKVGCASIANGGVIPDDAMAEFDAAQ
ncbi:MAG: hypothetical protein H7146_03945 [Burkholderiaceae bacterium]|nr:hypothetical protein [Microbacteriaceae bacterium]